MSEDGLSRRRVLGLAGSTVLGVGLAGCSALPLGDNPEEATAIPVADLQAVTEAPRPVIPRTLPVYIESSYLAEQTGRVREHLASVPTPLDETDVPNGAIRRELTHVRERAETLLDRAESAPTSFEAMETLRRARGNARTLTAAWAAIDEGLTREGVAGMVTEIEDARTNLLGRWRYVGEDPIRATVLHATIERYVASARRLATNPEFPRSRRPTNPLTIGEYAGHLERSLATLEDAAYCYDRYSSSLDDSIDLLVVLEGSAASLVEAVGRRSGDLPDLDPDEATALVDRDVSDTAAAEVIERFYWDVGEPDYVPETRAAGRPARTIVLAQGALARFRALESVREEINGGETYTVESSADVRAVRSSAIDAVTAARSASPAPVLTNRELSRLSSRLADADEEIDRYDDPVQPKQLDHVVSEYVAVRAIAAALPETNENVTTVLETTRP